MKNFVSKVPVSSLSSARDYGNVDTEEILLYFFKSALRLYTKWCQMVDELLGGRPRLYRVIFAAAADTVDIADIEMVMVPPTPIIRYSLEKLLTLRVDTATIIDDRRDLKTLFATSSRKDDNVKTVTDNRSDLKTLFAVSSRKDDNVGSNPVIKVYEISAKLKLQPNFQFHQSSLGLPYYGCTISWQINKEEDPSGGFLQNEFISAASHRSKNEANVMPASKPYPPSPS